MFNLNRLTPSSIITGLTYLSSLINNAHIPQNSTIVIYGDSLTDSGNGTKGSEGNNNYCHDILNGTHTCAPITNGYKTWVNYLTETQGRCAEKFNGLSKRNPEYNLIMAFASAESNDHWIDDLANQSYSSYTNCTYPQGNSTWDCIPSAIKQIELYEPVRQLTDYHVLWIGGNDFFNNIEKIIARIKRLIESNTTITLNKIPELSHLLNNIKKFIEIQLKAGVPKDHLFIGTLLDFSFVPAARQLAKGNTLILDGISAISFILNQAILSTVHSLLPAQQVLPFHTWIKQVFHNPEKYGINKTLAHRSCVADNAAPLCDGYAFFNGKHPTTNTHKVIADFVGSYLLSDKNPVQEEINSPAMLRH